MKRTLIMLTLLTFTASVGVAQDTAAPARAVASGIVTVTITKEGNDFKLTPSHDSLAVTEAAKVNITWSRGLGVSKAQLLVGFDGVLNRLGDTTTTTDSTHITATWEPPLEEVRKAKVLAVQLDSLPNTRARIVLKLSPTQDQVPACRYPAGIDSAIKSANDLNKSHGWFQGWSTPKAAGLVMDADGRILAAPHDGIREDQSVHAWLVPSPTRALTSEMVARSTPTRTSGAIQIAGEPPVPPAIPTGSGASPSACMGPQAISYFAPGPATITLTRASTEKDKTDRVKVAEFAVRVRKLYHGHITAGFARTRVIDPQFALTTTAGKTGGDNPKDTTYTVLRDGADSSERFVPVVFLTGFFPSPADLDGPHAYRDLSWWISPSIGFNPSRLTDEIFVGGTTHLGRIVTLNYGWHFARGKTLRNALADTATPYKGPADNLPTRSTTRRASFVAFAVDGAAAGTWLSAGVKNILGGLLAPVTKAEPEPVKEEKDKP